MASRAGPGPSELQGAPPGRGEAARRGLFFGLVLLAACLPIVNNDLWWHMKTGEWIVTEGRVPWTDPFTYTAGEARWVNPEWGFQVLAYGLHRLGGIDGLLWFRMGMVLIAFGLQHRFLRRAGVSAGLAGLLGSLALLDGRIRFFCRPELFTLIAVVLFTEWTLSGALFRPRGWWRPPVLGAILINLHPGAIIFPIFLAAMAIGEGGRAAWTGWRSRRGEAGGPAHPWARARRLGLLCLGTAGSLLINPYGYRALWMPFETLGFLQEIPFENREWVRAPLTQFPVFYLLAGLALALLWFARRRWRPAEAVLLLLLTAMALRHVRHVGLFCLAFPLFLGRFHDALPIPPALGRWLARPRVRVGITGAVLLGSVAYITTMHFPPGWGVARDRFPVTVTDYIQENDLQGPLYHDLGIGGYLTWRLWPERRTFIDSRHLFPDLLREIAAAVPDGARWPRFLDRYGIEYAVLRYNPVPERVTILQADGSPRVELRPFSVNHFPAPAWTLVAWDEATMLFVRTDGVNAPLAERDGYRWLHPESLAYLQAQLLRGAVDPTGVRRELERTLRAHPDHRRAREFLEVLFGPGGGEGSAATR